MSEIHADQSRQGGANAFLSIVRNIPVVSLVVWLGVLSGCANYPLTSSSITTLDGRPANGHIGVRQNAITPWVAHSATVEGYCFFGGANVSNVDGKFYALNGIAVDKFSVKKLMVDGVVVTLNDASKQNIEFAYFLNRLDNLINQHCDSSWGSSRLFGRSLGF